MGLATIDPHTIVKKEHTEIHKIPKFGVNRATVICGRLPARQITRSGLFLS